MTDLRQLHYRYRTDTGAVDGTPTWGAGEDASFNPGSANFRLRFGLINAAGTATGSVPWELYVSKNGGAYSAVTGSSTSGVISADAGSSSDETAILVPRLYPFSADWQLSGSAVDLDFVGNRIYPNGAVFTDYVSCSRASTGYAKTSSGTLTQFTSNALRIGTGTGLLIEDARTNSCLASQVLNNATGVWNENALTPTLNAGLAPDGTTTATRFVCDTSNTTHCLYRSISVTGPATISVYLRAAEYDYGYLECVEATDTNRSSIVVNLTTGEITSTGSAGSPATVTSSTEVLANGWCRLIMSSSASLSLIQFGMVNSGTPSYSNAAPTFTGDGSSSIYGWGAQCEAGAFVSSYIPTEIFATAARAADVITTIGGLQTDIAAATGSIVAQINRGLVTGAAANVVDSNGTNLLGFDATNHGLASIAATLATSNTTTRTAQDKLGIAWDASGRSLVLNGGTVATDASAQTPSSTQHIGSSGTDKFTCAYVERLTAWTSKLADATLQGHTGD